VNLVYFNEMVYDPTHSGSDKKQGGKCSVLILSPPSLTTRCVPSVHIVPYMKIIILELRSPAPCISSERHPDKIWKEAEGGCLAATRDINTFRQRISSQTSMAEIDGDVFSCILAEIPDSKTIYAILNALPKSHLLFPVALARLWELPVYLDSYDPRAAAASQKVLDYLLDNSSLPPLAESIRNLVVAIEHEDLGSRHPTGYGSEPDRTEDGFEIPADVLALHKRLPDLFAHTANLESLDYHSLPGIAMNCEHVEPLRRLERLRHLSVDCALRDREHEIPASDANYAAPGELSAIYDAENWE
jgi:hypothetical protein